MKMAIMQPYFFPYIGYFQLINAVDEFVVYDNIEYTKKGWINRNRILVNGQPVFITLPLKRDSDFLHVHQRFLADSWTQDRKKMLNRISDAYRKAPNFNEVFSLAERCVLFKGDNLFEFIYNTIVHVNEYLQIRTPVTVSSSILIDHSLRAAEKVLELCKARKAVEYLNPIGGVGLYNKEYFLQNGIRLQFIKSNDVVYNQFDNDFVPWLSIIDVMMFNTKEQIWRHLNSSYTVIE